MSLVVAAAAGGGAVAAAPEAARSWVLGAAVVAGVCVVVAVAVAGSLTRRSARAAERAREECDVLRQEALRRAGETAHLLNVSLPEVAKRLHDGAGAEAALHSVQRPADPQLAQLLYAVAARSGDLHARTAAAESGRARAEHTLGDVERLAATVLPEAVSRLRTGASAETVLAALPLPEDPRLRGLLERTVRDFADSERRAVAAQAASATGLGRVQAKTLRILADLRGMQDKYGGEVFGDLLQLDHTTSQLGLLTDRLALLMGGRSSRAWNKPIVMESILRGAVGRISDYRRVRLHSTSTASIAGFAAEGVMHLLAELMDNATNFSPPVNEVHVYVEEGTSGLVVTVEDSGLCMAPAAMRRAVASVSGQSNDLASLQGTRLGLAVVGVLAAKYGISVNYRPSSRGGTGVVVLLPPQLLAQQRSAPAVAPAPVELPRPAASPEAPVPQELSVREQVAHVKEQELPVRESQRPAPEEPAAQTTSTPNGLPVRPRGRTMEAADRKRLDADEAPAARPAPPLPGQPEAPPAPPRPDAGARFGAFHRSQKRQAPPSE
ncbi:histidine kinase [Streptomyces spiroverticillatus]|uniref:histidine kinase n=1 Tax=Streptomyces finlayi TaxID=67296 RepID=A0A919CEF1_9ACTN|nr:ATP-binding protein [Streptomyces finlayi]GHA39775.1 histidine kinase [Streptomyces spiroverticillatus]GHD14559.1 histidine kinase [Streptomyces finlayi]